MRQHDIGRCLLPLPQWGIHKVKRYGRYEVINQIDFSSIQVFPSTTWHFLCQILSKYFRPIQSAPDFRNWGTERREIICHHWTKNLLVTVYCSTQSISHIFVVWITYISVCVSIGRSVHSSVCSSVGWKQFSKTLETGFVKKDVDIEVAILLFLFSQKDSPIFIFVSKVTSGKVLNMCH